MPRWIGSDGTGAWAMLSQVRHELFGAHVADHLERAGHVFQHFRHVLAQRTQRAAAVRAGAGRRMLHHVARQVVGQRLACRLAAGGLCLGWRRRFRLRRRGLGELRLEFFQRQFELLDRAAQLLRRRTEFLAQQPRQPRLQLLVAQNLLLQAGARGLQLCRLAFEFRGLALHFGSLALCFCRMLRFTLQQQAAQSGDLARQCCSVQRHQHIRIFQHRFASHQVLICIRLRFPGAMCAPGRASRCLPAASTVAPRSALRSHPLPAAR